MGSFVGRNLIRKKFQPLLQFVIDSSLWLVALPLATAFRFRTQDELAWVTVVWVFLGTVIAQLFLGLILGLYRRRLRYASSEDLLRVSIVTLIIGLGLGIAVRLPFGENIRLSVPALAPSFAVLGMVGVRLVYRKALRASRLNPTSIPAVIVGAGDAAHSAVQLMISDPRSPFHPVALVDDDPLKHNLRILGIPVKGSIQDLVQVARETKVGAIVMAIPSADIDLVRLVDNLAREADLPLMVLPPATRLFSSLTLSDIRPVSDADLLGRNTVDIDEDALVKFIRGKRVLVTGAGGSIGSELCRQVIRFEPAALVMVDHDDTLLAEVQLSLEGRALLENPNLVLADIRDAERIEQVFAMYQPEIVFHAAALKHLTLLERFPREAWSTNVMGTVNVLQAAQRIGVKNFVNISTDKAADPTSVLGSSKRLTERLTAHFAEITGEKYVSVRFGNVLGSRGSVLTIFKKQVEQGGPITVTDPGATRYFMTVSEATRLTAFAGAIGRPGEALVLDMGAPIRIADVARRFARQYSPELHVIYTGLRSGEKMHESLFAENEEDLRPFHPLISHVPIKPLSITSLDLECRGINESADVSNQLITLANS